jgi:ribonuclease HII
MEELDKIYPEYKFAKNKGYGTKDHVQALLEYGPTEIHRTTFLKKILNSEEQMSFI